MSVYEGFAKVYDVFMQDAPYQLWLEFLQKNWTLASLDVVDIGCGTGLLTVPLARICCTCVGVDQSEAMLSVAQMRSEEERVRVIWMCQDALELRLPRRVQLAVSTCDVVNYIDSKENLVTMFKAIYRELDDGGSFVFDAMGPSRVRAFDEGYWHQVDDDAVLLHETSVLDGEIHHDVHMFVRDEDDEACYRRIEEHHVQWFYDADELVECLKLAGFENVIKMHDFLPHNSEMEPDRYVFKASK